MLHYETRQLFSLFVFVLLKLIRLYTSQITQGWHVARTIGYQFCDWLNGCKNDLVWASSSQHVKCDDEELLFLAYFQHIDF